MLNLKSRRIQTIPMETLHNKPNNDLPQDLYVYHLFPGLNLSKVIELTQMKPKLLDKTKKHIVKVGKWIGMTDVNDPRQVLCNMQINTPPQMIFVLFRNYFTEEILTLVCSWLNPYSYGHLDREDILDTWGQELDNISNVFNDDLNDCLDIVFDKAIIQPRVLRYEKEFGNKDLFQYLFPDFYPLFYQKLNDFLTSYFYREQINKNPFFHNPFLENGNLHPIIRDTTHYNANRVLQTWIFKN